MSQSDLSNRGLSVLNPQVPSSETTIIAVGVPRSGTSMIGAALDALGIPLGDTANGAVFEDVEIAGALESGDIGRLTQIVEERNVNHPTWGFKRPMAFVDLDKHLHLFRNPRVIVTFRDPAAIAKRNEISMHLPFLEFLEDANKRTNHLISVIRRLPCPVLVVSYEKALANPAEFISEFASFCGLAPTDSQRETVLSVIENGRDVYTRSSRIWYEGSFDGVSSSIARGWVRRMPMNTDCNVEIWDQHQLLGRGRANLPRSDLMGKIGDHAFEVHLASAPSDEVEAKVAGTTFILPRTKRFALSNV